ncbi:TolB family protein [Streptomyces sp. NPDC020412]|uniref:TolB family protein n=1 Tax=Streptomyces sp. NPDC020412 TaxID=3365073 RepID=UPI003798E237
MDRNGGFETVAALNSSAPARPSISGDGRYVAYQDLAHQTEGVYLRNRTAGTTSAPLEGPAKSASLVQLSDDGSKVVYLSGSDTYVHDVGSGTAQLVPNVTGVAIDPTGRHLLYAPNGTGGPSLVLRDLQTGADQTVSDQPATAEVDSVSAGGRDVVFQSAADGIVPGDANGTSDVFVRRFF